MSSLTPTARLRGVAAIAVAGVAAAALNPSPNAPSAPTEAISGLQTPQRDAYVIEGVDGSGVNTTLSVSHKDIKLQRFLDAANGGLFAPPWR